MHGNSIWTDILVRLARPFCVCALAAACGDASSGAADTPEAGREAPRQAAVRSTDGASGTQPNAASEALPDDVSPAQLTALAASCDGDCAQRCACLEGACAADIPGASCARIARVCLAGCSRSSCSRAEPACAILPWPQMGQPDPDEPEPKPGGPGPDPAPFEASGDDAPASGGDGTPSSSGSATPGSSGSAAPSGSGSSSTPSGGNYNY
jgi:hypothetical protein